MPASSDVEGGGRVPVGLRVRRLTRRRMVIVGILAAVMAAAVVGVVLRRGGVVGSSRPPPARLVAAPGTGWSGTSPIRGGVNTYGGLWLSNGERRPVVLTRARLVGATQGFQVVAIMIAGDRHENELSVPGFPARSAPNPVPIAGYVLPPLFGKPAKRLDQTGEIQIAYRVRPGYRSAGFRGIEVDYRFAGHPHRLVMNTSFTACPTGTGTVSQASDYCEAHEISTLPKPSNR